jgi:hypothetical protein
MQSGSRPPMLLAHRNGNEKCIPREIARAQNDALRSQSFHDSLILQFHILAVGDDGSALKTAEMPLRGTN